MFAASAPVRQILDACTQAIVVLNEAGRIVFFNRALLTITGPEGEGGLIGQKWGEAIQCAWAVEFAGCGRSQACGTCGANRVIIDALDGQYGQSEGRFVRKVNGMSQWLDLSIDISPVQVNEERFLVCSMRDISDEKRKGVLERIFFHDVRNSACAIEFLSSKLLGPVEGEVAVFAEQIRSCAAQLIDEIESQEQLTSAERDELAVNPVTFTSADLIQRALGRYSLQAAAAGRLLEVSEDSEDVVMYGDDAILLRVIGNMVKNALEALERGERVKIGCRRVGEDVEFWTNNPGEMSQPVQLQMFQRSFSTKGEGRGVGTYSMRLLSERYLRGVVTFRSSAAEGTTFTGRYPITWSPEASVETERTAINAGVDENVAMMLARALGQAR